MMRVAEYAKKLKMSVQALKLALQQDNYQLGQVAKTSENSWTYWIDRNRLEKFLKKDLQWEIYF